VLIKTIRCSGSGPGGGNPAVLVMAPPPLGRLSEYAEAFEGAMEKSARVAPFLEQIAGESNCAFLNAGEHVKVSEIDGLHLDAPAHARLGEVVAHRIQEMTKIQC
jgi:hypothetical protein